MNPLFALLLSLVGPGAGQVFNGQIGKGVAVGVLFALGKTALLPLIIRLFKITSEKGTLRLFYWFNIFYIALISYAAFDSFYYAFFTQNTRWLWAILTALIVAGVWRNTRNELVFTLLSGRAGIYRFTRSKKNSPTEK